MLVVGVLVGGCGNSNTISPASAVKGCSTAASCDLLGQSGIQGCASSVVALNDPALVAFFRVPLSGAEVNCLAAAGKDCNAAKRCLNNGMPPMTCSGSGPLVCSGPTLLQSCSNGNTTQFDCAFYGETCLSGRNNVACGAGTCSPGAGSCMGTSLQSCDSNGVYHVTSCAEIGSTCVTSGTAHCRGTGAACQGPVLGFGDNSLRCDGDKLINCFDGQEAAFDCTRLQLHCFPNAKGNHAACALGNQCDPGNAMTVCNGTVLSFCNNGKPDTYDCASGGWSRCIPDNGGSCS